MKQRPYQELGEKLDKIIKEQKPIEQEMEAILSALKEANKRRVKPAKTPSIKHGMQRTLAIVQAGVGAEIARECLSKVHMLVVFEDIKDLLDRENPEVTQEDIHALKGTSWPSDSPRMKTLIGMMERLANGDNESFKLKEKVLNSDPQSKKIRKTVERETSVLQEARMNIDRICIGAKLIITVNIAHAIAVAYLKEKGVQLPKNKARFTANSGKKLSSDADIRIHQILYDISCLVDEVVHELVIKQDYKKFLPKGIKIRVLFIPLTEMLDKASRVPKITEGNYHLSATFLHVLSRLQVAIDNDPGIKCLLGRIWGIFYTYTFHSGKDFSGDYTENGMLQNLERFVKEYEEGLQNGAKEENVNGLQEGVQVEKEEDSSSLGDSFGCG